MSNPALLPIYSGFIYVKNTINGQIGHVSCKRKFIVVCFVAYKSLLLFIDAGVVGNYSNAQILVRNSSTNIRTGVLNNYFQYVTDSQLMNLSATSGILTRIVLAWCTRNLFIEVVSTQKSNLSGSYAR